MPTKRKSIKTNRSYVKGYLARPGNSTASKNAVRMSYNNGRADGFKAGLRAASRRR